jgi:hypothetical protein
MPRELRRRQADPARRRERFIFEADAVAVEEPPNRSKPRLLLTLIEQAALDLFQRQIGFTPHQLKQP